MKYFRSAKSGTMCVSFLCCKLILFWTNHSHNAIFNYLQKITFKILDQAPTRYYPPQAVIIQPQYVPQQSVYRTPYPVYPPSSTQQYSPETSTVSVNEKFK
jgi:hypothetical protein